MTNINWLERWENGKTGWHETNGNLALRDHWQADGGRVLVPLCGKTPDLMWLAQRGHEVSGVELSEIAIRDFFAEQGLGFTQDQSGALDRYRCQDLPITLYCGDYFEFQDQTFDALYDRGALVAVDPDRRADYVAHTRSLLRPGAAILLIALEYDQQVVAGPPFSMPAHELSNYWDNLQCIEEKDAIDSCPPRFREAGLKKFTEVAWRS